MWSLEKQGRGRRATILSVSNEKETYRPGDFVSCDGFTGVVSRLKQGETENSHQVELLHLAENDEEDSNELFATSILKWYPVSVLGKKLEPKPHPKRAIDHHRRRTDKIVDINLECGSDVQEYANYIAAQFVGTPSSRKAKAAQKPILHPSPSSSEEEREFSDDSSDFSIDIDDEETLPTRKRSQGVKGVTNALASTSLKRNNKRTRAQEPATEDDSGTESTSPKKKVGRSPRKNRANQKPEPVPAPDLNGSSASGSPKKTGRKPSPRKRSATKEASVNSIGNHSTNEFDSSSDDEDAVPGSLIPVTPRKERKLKSIPSSPFKMRILKTDTDKVLANLHPASIPESFPCRDSQFDQLFYALEGAIEAETGTCVYVSGTPGTGKTSTIKEVLGQLYLRVNDKELKPFTYLEINGMKLVHPNAAYEHLWEVMGNKSMAASNAMTALEASFTKNDDKDSRGVIVVLLDELDQLVTKGQQLMYNFFNWPSLPHSRLVVIAVANTMDLPERILSNKISSRVGLTRIQFPGYTQEELKSIVVQRLGADLDLIEPNAIEYVTRKVAGVGGDARRVLDFTRKGIVHARAEARQNASEQDVKSLDLKFRVKISHIRDVIVESQTPPTVTFVKTLGVTAKVLLCAVLMRTRREDAIEVPLHDVLKQARQLVRSSVNATELSKWLYPSTTIGNSGRIALFQHAVMELVEAGILVQQAIAGEATPRIRLMVPANLIRDCLINDSCVKGML